MCKVISRLVKYSLSYRISVYSVQHTVYIIQCTAYSVQHTVYIIQCTVYSVQRTTPTIAIYLQGYIYIPWDKKNPIFKTLKFWAPNGWLAKRDVQTVSIRSLWFVPIFQWIKSNFLFWFANCAVSYASRYTILIKLSNYFENDFCNSWNHKWFLWGIFYLNLACTKCILF